MFYRTEIKDHIRVPPNLFDKPKAEAVLERVKKKYEGFISKDFGIVIDVAEVKEILANTSGVVLQDDPQNNVYPMPLNAHGKDEVFVGRIRRDESAKNTLNMWIVADNLRKGAATNAVQIAEYMIEHSLVHPYGIER